ncbi:MAG: SDR family oxidoreductase [Myxococcales bacterium]
MQPLLGQRALVTGAGVRVGRAIADHLVDLGVSVAFHCHGSRAGAEAGVERARGKGVTAALLEADLSDWDAARALPGRAAEALGGLDIAVSSAAIFERVPFERIDRDALRRMLALDFEGPFALAQGAAAALHRPGGSLIHVLDVGALEPWRGYAHYCSAKAALAMLTRVLAIELAPDLRVNGVAPGTVLWPEGYGEAERAAELRRIPLGRAGSPADVAEAVAFLCRSGYVTGEILRVDGGRAV